MAGPPGSGRKSLAGRVPPLDGLRHRTSETWADKSNREKRDQIRAGARLLTGRDPRDDDIPYHRRRDAALACWSLVSQRFGLIVTHAVSRPSRDLEASGKTAPTETARKISRDPSPSACGGMADAGKAHQHTARAEPGTWRCLRDDRSEGRPPSRAWGWITKVSSGASSVSASFPGHPAR